MPYRIPIASIALVAALCATVAGAQAFDETKYPDWKGRWGRVPVAAAITGQPSLDPNKSDGPGFTRRAR